MGRCLFGDVLPDIGQRLTSQRVAHRLFRAQHDEMYRANSSGRPLWRSAAENRTAPPDFLAIEQWLPAFDGVDDLQHADVLRHAGQEISAAYATRCVDNPRPFELGENLSDEAVRNTLKIGKIAAAERFVGPRQPQEAVKAVFNTDR